MALTTPPRSTSTMLATRSARRASMRVAARVVLTPPVVLQSKEAPGQAEGQGGRCGAGCPCRAPAQHPHALLGRLRRRPSRPPRAVARARRRRRPARPRPRRSSSTPLCVPFYCLVLGCLGAHCNLCSLQQYFENRLKAINELAASGPFPPEPFIPRALRFTERVPPHMQVATRTRTSSPWTRRCRSSASSTTTSRST